MRPDDGKVEEHCETILHTVHKYPRPCPHNFDPLTATDHQLEKFGLPGRPDSEREPDLFRFWELMLGPCPPPCPPLNVIVPEFEEERLAFRYGNKTQRSIGSIRRFGHRQHSRRQHGENRHGDEHFDQSQAALVALATEVGGRHAI